MIIIRRILNSCVATVFGTGTPIRIPAATAGTFIVQTHEAVLFYHNEVLCRMSIAGFCNASGIDADQLGGLIASATDNGRVLDDDHFCRLADELDEAARNASQNHFLDVMSSSGIAAPESVATDIVSGDAGDLRPGRGSGIRTARRCIRVYFDLLHGLGTTTVDLSSLSDVEMETLREMILEMYDSYQLMNVGNSLLFVDDELNRRRAVAQSGGHEC